MSRLVRESQRARVDRETLFAISKGRKPPIQIYWERLQASELGLPGPTENLPYMRKPELRAADGIDITYNSSEAALLRSGELGQHFDYRESFSNVLGKRVRDVQGGRLRGEVDQARFTTDEFGNPVEPFSELDERELITVSLEKMRARTVDETPPVGGRTPEQIDLNTREFVDRARTPGDPTRRSGSVETTVDPDPDRLTDNVRVIFKTDNGETIFLDPSGRPMVQLEDGRGYEVCHDIENFLARAARGANTALGKDSPPLIVAHGGIHWALCYHMVIENHPWKIGNCELVYFQPIGTEKWEASIIS